MGRYLDGLTTIVKMLEEIGGMTRKELAQMTGRTESGILSSLTVLRKKRLVRIGRYERQPDGVKGPPAPVYVVGSGQDAPPPPPIGKREVDRRYKRRHAAIVAARRIGDHYKDLGIWRGLVR